MKQENTADIVGEKRELLDLTEEQAASLLKNASRRSFLMAGASGLAAITGYRWLRGKEQAWVFQEAFEVNQSLSQAGFSPHRLAPTFRPDQIEKLKVNGGEGMSQGFDPKTWKLQVVGVHQPERYKQYALDVAYETAMDNSSPMLDTNELHVEGDAKELGAGSTPAPDRMDRAPAMKKTPGLLLTLEDIQSLPKVEMITELKCIEGWSTVVGWGGVKFSDFLARFLPGTRSGKPPSLDTIDDLLPYASLVTPDGGYYTGWDMQSLLHPQTLLCYEMNGAPLSLDHGAPLRLVSTVKYGIKQIKRIGRITFMVDRPADYWAEQGYDWYSGH